MSDIDFSAFNDGIVEEFRANHGIVGIYRMGDLIHIGYAAEIQFRCGPARLSPDYRCGEVRRANQGHVTSPKNRCFTVLI